MAELNYISIIFCRLSLKRNQLQQPDRQNYFNLYKLRKEKQHKSYCTETYHAHHFEVLSDLSN